jgi:flagellar biosynthesis/type III secretory pathway protein FliH
MTPHVRLDITTPIGGIEMLDAAKVDTVLRNRATAAESKQTLEHLARAGAALNKAASELDACRQSLFGSHREHIVRLSLEIAAKILAKEVAEGNYSIENIVMDALQSAPPAKQRTIRLNPDDLKAFEKAAVEQNISLPPNTELAADWSVRPADCIIDGDTGMVEYMMDEHLRNIGEALLESSETI